jgi:hypothetical protein
VVATPQSNLKTSYQRDEYEVVVETDFLHDSLKDHS